MTTAEPDIQPTPAVNLSELRFGYEAGHDVISIEQFRIEASERLFLCGPSGSGKSTLLALVGGVIAAKRGELSVLGEDLVNAKSATRDRVRADHIGFIFQQFNLVPYLSVEQNVQLPCRYSPRRWQRAVDGDGSLNDASTRLLSALGIDRSMHARRATALSVGQQQRVAVARALIGSPELIIADEPTSALDSDRRREFIDLLLAECERTSSAVVFVSHDGALADHFDRAVDLQSINRPETVVDA